MLKHGGWNVCLAALMLAVPPSAAGTRDDPELLDPEGDVIRWPGVPTVDPSSDFTAVWFHEDEENLYISMEVVMHMTYDPQVPYVLYTASHLIGAHVNGPAQEGTCIWGWGVFNVRDSYYDGQGWRAMLRIYWPEDQQDQGCAGDDHDVPVTVDDNVVTVAVPWVVLAGHVGAGDELTVSDARAGSGSTWPASPADYADNAPGRPFVVEHGPPSTQPEGARPNAPDEPSPQDDPRPEAGGPPNDANEAAHPGSRPSPLPWWLLLAALFGTFAARRP